MLNRHAARHLLLVVSILLCAFIYAGYSLATRGEADPAEDAAPPAENTVSGLRPAGDAAALLIPPANGEELSLTPPAAQPMRPPSSAPASPAPVDAGAISGLVPDSAAAAANSSGMMPGASLPLPGFAAAPADVPEDEASAVPVLTLPGMTAAGGAGDDFGDEDFGDAAVGEDDGDFAALPGFDAPAEEGSAAVLPPPPGAAAAAPAAAPRATTPAPPPAASTTAPAAETGTVLRPPPQSAPAAPLSRSTSDVVMGPTLFTPPPPARNAFTPPPPAPLSAAPARAVPPAPSRTAPPLPRTARADGMAGENDDDMPGPGPRSDSLRIYVVRPGDTLSSIAMRELGSGFLADNIFLLNRDVIDDPNHLMSGVKIRLPYANPAEGGAETDPSVAGAAPGRRPTQGLGGTHRVVRGDTLSSIAQQYYGRSAAWSFLHEANKAIIPDPNQLTVGMELTIPPYGE